MNLLKQYITQTISSASNSLRLSTEKIEVVALLRQAINQSGDLSEDIKKMKRITELSKLAIKINEIYNFLTKDQVDFQKISDKFREHSQYLIKDINQMLDSVSPASFKILMEKIQSNSQDNGEKEVQSVVSNPVGNEPGQPETEAEFRIREPEYITPEVEKTGTKNNIKEKILETIRPLDDFLKKMGTGTRDEKLLDHFLMTVKENGEISDREGYGTVAEMHNNICKALELFKSGGLTPTTEVTESIRACLIVIATLIRNKEVDIRSYLNLAEEFGKKLKQ